MKKKLAALVLGVLFVLAPIPGHTEDHGSPGRKHREEENPLSPDETRARPFMDKSGRTCREYQSKVVINGETKPAYGKACLQPDGSWRVAR